MRFLLQGRCGYWQLTHNICCLSSALSFLLSQNSGKAMEMTRHLNGSGGGPQWHLLCLPKHNSMMSCLNSPGKYLLNSIVDTQREGREIKWERGTENKTKTTGAERLLGEWKVLLLILCVNVASLWCPVWSNTSLDVTCEDIFQI